MEFTLADVTLLIGEIGGLLSMIIPAIVCIGKIMNGQRCQLRHDMLEIYYKNVDKKELRQFEYEDFDMLYKAYKALRGNSFIDKIHKEIEDEWKVIP